jgi:rod shape-determining protein MreB
MSVLKYIQSIFSSDLYIQLWENRIKISRIGTNDVYDEEPLMAIKENAKGVPIVAEIGNKVKRLNEAEIDKVVNPFKHPRLLVHDFVVAEKIVQHAFRQLHKTKWIAPSPRVIFQPMEKLEGGVTGIEERVYRELCLGAGAREILLHVGKPLSSYSLDFNDFKQKNS